MTAATATVSVLSSDECYQLLTTRGFGRIGVIADHHPMIVPVNYAMDRSTIVIRSRPGRTFDNAMHANVTFQVDDIDEVNHTGWSVLVQGLAEEVTRRHSPELIRRTEATDLEPWAPGESFHWVRIIPHGISGRRIGVPGGDDWHLGTAAYM